MASTLEQQIQDLLFNLNQDVDNTSESLQDLMDSSDSLTRGFGNTLDASAKLTKQFSSTAAAVGAGNSEFSTLNGIVKLVGNTMSSLAGTVTTALVKFPMAGAAVKAFGDGATEVMTYAIGQTEAGFKAFQTLSSIGQIGTKGIKELNESIRETGLPLQTYVSLLTKNNEALVYVAGSTTEGANIFKKSMKELANESGFALRRLGYSVNEIGDTMVSYQKLQKRLGFSQEQIQSNVTSSTIEYGKELDLIAKLTGQSRESVQKEREDQLRDSRWTAHLNKLDSEERLRMIKASQLITKRYGETAGKAFRGRATGFYTGEAEQQGLRMGIDKVFASFQSAAMAGDEQFRNTLEANDSMMIKKIKQFADTWDNTIAAVGDLPAFMPFHEMYAAMNKENLKGVKELWESIGLKVKESTSPATDDLINAQQSLQKTTSNINATFIGTKLATMTIRGFAEALEAVTEEIYKFSEEFSSTNSAVAEVEDPVHQKRINELSAHMESINDLEKMKQDAIKNKDISSADAIEAQIKEMKGEELTELRKQVAYHETEQGKLRNLQDAVGDLTSNIENHNRRIISLSVQKDQSLKGKFFEKARIEDGMILDLQKMRAIQQKELATAAIALNKQEKVVADIKSANLVIETRNAEEARAQFKKKTESTLSRFDDSAELVESMMGEYDKSIQNSSAVDSISDYFNNMMNEVKIITGTISSDDVTDDLNKSKESRLVTSNLEAKLEYVKQKQLNKQLSDDVRMQVLKERADQQHITGITKQLGAEEAMQKKLKEYSAARETLSNARENFDKVNDQLASPAPDKNKLLGDSEPKSINGYDPLANPQNLKLQVYPGVGKDPVPSNLPDPAQIIKNDKKSDDESFLEKILSYISKNDADQNNNDNKLSREQMEIAKSNLNNTVAQLKATNDTVALLRNMSSSLSSLTITSANT